MPAFHKMFRGILVSLLLVFTLQAKAQFRDTVLVDYNTFFCNICSDPDYNCLGSDSVSFTDSTSGALKLVELKFLFLHTPCTSSPTTLFLNGDTMGSWNNSYSCQCNSCTRDSIIVTGSKLAAYNQNGSNKFVYKGGSTLCIARYMIIRTWKSATDYDMATQKLVGPVLGCPGSQDIEVQIANFGLKQVDSVELHWSYNGVTQTTVKDTGTIDTLGGAGSNTKTVKLGSKTLVKGKLDTLVAWTEKPNGMTDTFRSNDTLTAYILPALKDTFTIGGSSPDFVKIQDAFDALMQYGVCGPVVLNIRTGTYTEQLVLGAIPGSDTTNTITVRSETGDSSDVKIVYSASSAFNFTILLDQTGHVHFRFLTLESTSTSYGRVVALGPGTESVSFANCRILGASTFSTTDFLALIYSYSTTLPINNITVQNCLIEGGNYGFYIYSPFLIPGSGFFVNNCVFTGQYHRNISIWYSADVHINNNSLTKGTTSTSYGHNILLQYNVGAVRVACNRMTSLGAGIGIEVSSNTGDTNNVTHIYNNFASITSAYASSCTPLRLNYANHVRVSHNSFFAECPYSSNVAVQTNYGSNIVFTGNSIFNKNPGRAWYVVYSSPNILHSNHNNIYSLGSSLGYWNTSVADLAGWQSASGQDSSSKSVDPGYKSTTDLHATAVELNGNADPGSGIMDDIDKEPRDSVRPDIGADEFKLPPVDAALIDLKKFKADSSCVEVILRNLGDDTLKSVTIAWVFDGVTQTPYSWTGALASGDTAKVCVGTKVFKRDSAYNIKLWTSLPNGVADTVNGNDTISKRVFPALCGVYTIGGTTPDYPSFNAARIALDSAGVLDSALFKVRDGTYTEQVHFTEIECANKKNSVIFESESGDSTKVILDYGSASWSNNYVLWFDGADGITFRKMTISNSSSFYRRVIFIESSANDLEFRNNIILNGDSTGTSTSSALIYNESSADHNLCLINNHLLRGSFGYYGRGSFSDPDQNLIIRGNHFDNQGYEGILATYYHTTEINQNRITSRSPSYWIAMNLDEFRGVNRIEKNKIEGPNLNERYGMFLNDFDFGDTAWILNNFISIGGTNTFTRALYVEDFTAAMIFNNSVYQYSTDTSNSNAVYFEGGTFNSCNNNFVCGMGGYALYLNFGTLNSNYNNLRTPTSNLTYWNGTSYGTLAAHITGTSADSNSINTDPKFFSATDLHTSNPAMDRTGKSVPYVMDDIDGDARDTVPDIGADEFVPAKHDIGVLSFISPAEVFAADTQDIKVVIYNFGTDTVFSGVVKTKFNSDTLADKSFSDTLLSGDTLHLLVGSYVFKADTLYSFMAWTTLPNGVTDQKMSNDTAKVKDKLPAMSGIYTIGGSSPDFPSFTAAIEAMKTKGIADSVKFKVRSGTYTEQLLIPNISGATTKNQIIFEGESLDSSLVILSFTSTKWDTNYTVRLDGADGITFRHMTIQALSTGFGRVVQFENGSDYFCIENCQILGINTTSSSSYYFLISSSSSRDDHFTLRNSFLSEGSSAIFLEAPSTYSNREIGTRIMNNTLSNFHTYGIFLYYQKGSKIVGNTIRTNTTTASYQMVYLYYNTDSFCFTRNTLINENNGYGFYAYFPGSANSDSCVISNNMISIGSATASRYGMDIYSPRGLHIAHNSINLMGNGNTSFCLGVDGGGGNNEIKNNIFENQASGYAFSFRTPASITTCDYNNLRTSGTQIGYYSASALNSLANWRSTTGLDSNSTEFNPNFKANDDLHLDGVDLDGTVMRVPYVLDDIDKQSRDSLADVGADEIELKGLDAGIAKILTPNQPFKSDTQYVKVVLKNFGKTTLTSVDIHWVLNGDTGTVYKWSDTLVSKDTACISIEKKFFDLDSTYSLKVWTAKPNNGTDQEAKNDTAETVDQYPALSGPYTIGGASPDFTDFTAAIDAMKKGGIVDSVVFTVRNGTYNEQLTIPRILGADSKNSIIFQSAGTNNTANVVLHKTGTAYLSNWVLKLDSAVGVTFRRITLTNPATSYATILWMTNNSDYNEFRECVFQGNTLQNTTSINRALVYTDIANSHNNDFNCFVGNEFISGSVGLYIYGYNGGVYDRNWMIKNNSFENHYYMGVYQRYCDTTTLHGNTFEHDGTYRTSTNYGFYLQYHRGGVTVTSNSAKGMVARPMALLECDGLSSIYSLIANNMIHSSHSGAYGLHTEWCDFANIYNNSIHTSSAGANRALYNYYGSNLTLVNNNLVESGSGYAWYQYGGGSIFTRINHNNYYGAGSNLAYFNWSDRSNFAALKSATAKDTNSLNVDPSFVAADDLHAREITLDEAGTPLALVPYDFDLDMRDSTKPDIGADEFEPPAPEDAGVLAYHGPVAPFKHGSQNVEAILKNFGSDTLVSATINWKVNGTTQTAHSWTGSLLPGAVDTVHIGSFHFNRVTQYDMIIWSTVPNGVTDTLNYNDTAVAVDIYAALDTTYIIGSSGADFPDFTTATTVLQKAGIIDTVTFRVQSGTYNEQISIGSFAGSSASRPVTFESVSGDSSTVILTHNSPWDSNYLVRITGADYLTFRNMTFKPTNYYYGHCFDISGGSIGLNILNNQFLGYTNPYWYYSIAILSSTDNDDSCRIENNLFSQGNEAIQLYGLGYASPEKGTIIRNNRIVNGARNAIQIQNQENALITTNRIEFKSNTTTKVGIQATNLTNGLEISCNNITSNGIYDCGILVQYDGIVSNQGTVANNFIALKNNSSGRYGIYSNYSEYLNIVFNSVNLYGGTATGSYAMRMHYGADNQLKNNIFCNRNGGFAFYQFGSGVAQSDYNDLYTTGTNIGYLAGNITNLAAWQTATSKDANSMSIDPLFTSNSNLHVYISNLDSAGTPISGITEDIDKDTRNTTHPDIGADEFNSLLHNLGVAGFTKPLDGCDLDSQIIGIKIFNYGSQPQTNYSVSYRVDGGTIVKDTITDTIGPGATKTYEFMLKHKFVAHKTFVVQAWTTLALDQDASNDSSSTNVINYATPGMVSNMFPLDTSKNLDYPITFSWAPASGATKYDLYIWDDTASARPGSPFKSDITQISTQVSTGLAYGRTFKWQVVAKNSACGTDGPIQKFTMRFLPDLIVESASSPTTAFSGNSISVSWKVKNIGSGTTGSSTWYDLVYLSTDTVYDSGDLYVGGKANAASLSPSSNYSQSMSINLQNGFTGTYYVIVRTDPYGAVIESDAGNNTGADTAGMVVSLTPPPDLIVTGIVRPTIAFSGTTININFTVKNDGTGTTRNGFWYDYIYWSADTSFGAGATYLKRIRRNADLDVDSMYTVATPINVPHFIQGRHYVYVVTDGADHEYEHTSETNNVTRSDTIGVILSPPPDLVVKDVVVKDTVSACESVTLTYNTINQGGGNTMRSFSDYLYYSLTPVYNPTTAKTLKSKHNAALAAGDTAMNSMTFTVPNNLSGKLYLFIETDRGNRVNENTHENNNFSSVDSIFIQTPDLIVPLVSTSAADTTGDTTLIKYEVVNQGNGAAIAKWAQDQIYISHHPSFDPDSCTILSTKSYYNLIESGDTIRRTRIVTIPDGFDGNRYFYVYTDVGDKIFEDGQENNNTGRSDTVKIKLAPYPDLVPVFVTVPDTANAGDTATISFTVTNNGDTTASANWMDRIYISTDTVLDTKTDRQLTAILHTSDLEKDSSYTVSTLLTIPAAVAAGNYYYFIFTDQDLNVYEHHNDSNNTARSGIEYIDGYPPVDLKAMSLTAGDTMYSGKTVAVSWVVKNIGQAATIGSFWNDCIYISSDSVWNSTDTRIHTEQVNTTLQKDSSYTVNASFTLPNGLSGDYYIFVRVDKADANNDVDTSNNTGGKRDGGSLAKTKIILTPPPDLQVAFKSVPSTGTSGQPIKVVWQVTNEGTGPTLNGYWTDQIYLSTDYTVDNSDYRIGGLVHQGNLDKDSSYCDSLNVFIPAHFSGNYVLIIITDAENREYEFDKENNNNIASLISVSKSPPADLIVSDVSTVDSAVSGDVVTVDWTIKNLGINPASGSMRDNVYLSSDTVVDAADKLLGSKNYSISLVKDASTSNSMSVTVGGVALGDYFILVKTDILNNINESNDTNNTGISDEINIDIPQLFIGVKKSDTLFDLKEKIYRLHIADSLKGESLLVTLDADSANGNNEMYLRRGAVPTRSEFDFGYSDPFAGDQEIIVPELDTGAYHLMVYGDNTAGTFQPMDLLARILEFEIRKITPSKGGNTGDVTVQIDGSKFNDSTQFSLVNESGSITPLVPDSLEDAAKARTPNQLADTFKIVDPTRAFITFRLTDQELGVYDVIGVNVKDSINLDTTVLSQAFTVQEGLPPDLQLNVTRPANARTNRIVSFDVHYTNKGNTDIVNGELEILSNGTTPISFTLDGLSDNKTKLTIPIEENEGIEGRLRPGGSGTVKIYTKATNTLGFSIVLPE